MLKNVFFLEKLYNTAVFGRGGGNNIFVPGRRGYHSYASEVSPEIFQL